MALAPLVSNINPGSTHGGDPSAYKETLNTFDRICIIDLGARGTGHQSAVIKLLDSLAGIGWSKTVYLSYNAQKTKFFAERFGKGDELDDPIGSYRLYNEQWEVENYGGFSVVCIPNKGGPHGGGSVPTEYSINQEVSGLSVPITKKEYNEYKDSESQYKGVRQDNPGYSENPLEWAKMIKWTEKAWPTKEEKDAPEPDNFREQSNLRRKKKFKKDILKQNDAVVRIKYAPKLPVQQKTLTMFAASDVSISDFNDNYVQDVAEMVCDSGSNVIMIFQPFLWANNNKRIRVQEGDSLVVDDVAALMERSGQKAVYRLDVRTRKGVVLSDTERKIAMYYSEEAGNSFETVSENLIKALTKYDVKYPTLRLNTIISIIGDISDDKWNSLEEIERPGNIRFERVGRLGKAEMAKYQRTSDFFITEGANTSQELYATGTPTLSAYPSGHTKPWEEAFPEGAEAKRMVLGASEQLLDFTHDSDDLEGLELNPLIQFIGQTREQNNASNKCCLSWSGGARQNELHEYFGAWSTCLGDEGSDQVVGALKAYHDYISSKNDHINNLHRVELY